MSDPEYIGRIARSIAPCGLCLLYTSDAADE